MAKKHWIYVTRELLTNPGHRAELGETVWLYLYLLDRADWSTGIVTDWRDEEEAASMGLNARTLRTWRQRLGDRGYISWTQGLHKLNITIHNWVNPRECYAMPINARETGQGDAFGFTQLEARGEPLAEPIPDAGVPAAAIASLEVKDEGVAPWGFPVEGHESARSEDAALSDPVHGGLEVGVMQEAALALGGRVSPQPAKPAGRSPVRGRSRRVRRLPRLQVPMRMLAATEEPTVKQQASTETPILSRMSPAEARRVPTLKLFLDATGFLPGPMAWEYIDAVIRRHGLTQARVHDAAVLWAASGFKPENVKGMLEWAIRGRAKDGHDGRKPTKGDAEYEATQRMIREMDEKRARGVPMPPEIQARLDKFFRKVRVREDGSAGEVRNDPPIQT